MKYVIALAIAGIIIAGLSIHMQQRARSIQQRMRQKLIDAKQTGELPADYDVDQQGRADIGMELPASEIQEIKLVDLWFNIRIYLCSVLVIGSIVIAAFVGNSDRKNANVR